jgi:hypothetical protein
MIPGSSQLRKPMNRDRKIAVYQRRGSPQFCATFAPSKLAGVEWSLLETVDEQQFHPDTVYVIERDEMAYGERSAT